MSTMPTLTEQIIRTFVGEQNFQQGQHHVRDGAIVNPERQVMALKAYCYFIWDTNSYATHEKDSNLHDQTQKLTNTYKQNEVVLSVKRNKLFRIHPLQDILFSIVEDR